MEVGKRRPIERPDYSVRGAGEERELSDESLESGDGGGEQLGIGHLLGQSAVEVKEAILGRSPPQVVVVPLIGKNN